MKGNESKDNLVKKDDSRTVNKEGEQEGKFGDWRKHDGILKDRKIWRHLPL